VQGEAGEVDAVELGLLDPALADHIVETSSFERRTDVGRPRVQRCLDGHSRRPTVMMGP